ncbi:hypothetical protein CTAYLR_006658 [Chrysophaeum taylorii]|uniref:Hexosyltransferase n=1 Tax=Chrysophaeum taylorii TaxID=2483200 RepID=A0AAD7UG18_9STRA|nr:hypothetical protein CTAYLR_006658 [Chrysophaeum taylorii]
MLRLLALAACTLSSIDARLDQPLVGVGEISEDEVGVRGNGARNAYFVMIGPMDTQRKYGRWLFSALAIANALSRLGSEADFVLLLARYRERQHATVRLLASETQMLSRVGARWRYLSAPGERRIPGFHLGNYKLAVWQHTEYHFVQLLDADVLPIRSMDPLFRLPSMVSSSAISCPGRIAPLNAGWIALVPSRDHYEALVALLDRYQTEPNDALPWGRELDGWYNSDGKVQPPGWDFFDAQGNQGHLYSYFRFDARSLAILFHALHLDYRLTRYDRINQGRTKGTPLPPPNDVATLLSNAFPCPFSARGRGVVHAYLHFTGQRKPWTKFSPDNARDVHWYHALLAHGNASAMLGALFPGEDPHHMLASLKEATRRLKHRRRR